MLTSSVCEGRGKGVGVEGRGWKREPGVCTLALVPSSGPRMDGYHEAKRVREDKRLEE
jgi:hypothetical protein